MSHLGTDIPLQLYYSGVIIVFTSYWFIHGKFRSPVYFMVHFFSLSIGSFTFWKCRHRLIFLLPFIRPDCFFLVTIIVICKCVLYLRACFWVSWACLLLSWSAWFHPLSTSSSTSVQLTPPALLFQGMISASLQCVVVTGMSHNAIVWKRSLHYVL